MEQDDCILYLECVEPQIFKGLTEWLHLTIPIVIMRFSTNGLKIQMDNAKQLTEKNIQQRIPETFLAVVNIQKFHKYIIPKELREDETAEMTVIAEAANMKIAFNGVLKKDLLKMSIYKSDPTKLHIELSNNEKDRKVKAKVSLLSDTNPQVNFRMNPSSPCHYDMRNPTASCLQKEFLKVCKANSTIKAEMICVQAQFGDNFKSSGIKFQLTNGESEKSFDFGDWDESQPPNYEENFPIKSNFGPLQKVCSYTSTVRVYCGDVRIMLISMDLEKSGSLDIYFVPRGDVGNTTNAV